MAPGLLHLHTYFLFPFSVDKQTVMRNHEAAWSGKQYWIDGLDEWIAAHGPAEKCSFVANVGRWKRAAYQTYAMDSPAYQDMVFFHPFVRRVFFDTQGNAGESENLLRCYAIPLEGKKLFFEGEDLKGRKARLQVTD